MEWHIKWCRPSRLRLLDGRSAIRASGSARHHACADAPPADPSLCGKRAKAHPVCHCRRLPAVRLCWLPSAPVAMQRSSVRQPRAFARARPRGPAGAGRRRVDLVGRGVSHIFAVVIFAGVVVDLVQLLIKIGSGTLIAALAYLAHFPLKRLLPERLYRSPCTRAGSGACRSGRCGARRDG